jgi:predicted adenine nucleotide alpha hydrolase (AANH) superfamily ATPase
MLISICGKWQTSKLLKLIQEIEKEKTWLKYFYEANITPISKPDKVQQNVRTMFLKKLPTHSKTGSNTGVGG